MFRRMTEFLVHVTETLHQVYVFVVNILEKFRSLKYGYKESWRT